ncbi:MAG: hypothetical protein WC795_02180 [Candidatus Paceibacterota bacterium]|jgi:L-2-hydroxyglutarate oxidase LhgO
MNKELQDSIIKNFGLDALPEKDREEMVISIGGAIYEAVLTRAMAIMSEADQDELEKIIDEERGPDVLLYFLGQKVPGLQDMINEEIEKMKNESHDIMSQI